MNVFVNVSVQAYYQNLEHWGECQLEYILMEESQGKVNVWTLLNCKRETKEKTKIWKLAVLCSWGLGMDTSH